MNANKPVQGSGGVSPGHCATEYWFEEGCYITEWMNNADNPDMSVARARVPAGTTTRWHSLHATTERYVILAGTGMVEIGHQPAQPVLTGDSVTIPAGVAQRIRADVDGDLIFLAICTPRFEPACYRRLQEGPGG